jgi:hypothetical protein
VAAPSVAPIGVVAAAYGLWLLSDRLLYVGPFDRAAFGWLVVVPLWLAVPVAAAVSWRTRPFREAQRAALLLAVLIGSAATILLWAAVTSDGAACETGPRATAAGFIVPAFLVGALVGAAPSLGGLLGASRLSSGRSWKGVGLAVGIDLGLTATAVLLAVGVILSSGGCQRPG